MVPRVASWSSIVLAAGVAAALAWSPAAAGPRRPGLTAGVVAGSGVGTSGGERGPGITLGAHLGYLLAGSARVGFEAQLFGGQAWLDRHRIDGVLLGALRLWPADRLTLTFGLGVAAGDDRGTETLVGAGAAAGATLGVDVRRWSKSALSLGAVVYGGDFDDTRAIHVGLVLGVEWYGVTNPPPGS